jgi:hypothetical protein
MELPFAPGPVTERVLTFLTPESGEINIQSGDALKLASAFTVTNAATAEDAVIGQAMAAVAGNNQPVSVVVRGVCIFDYDGADVPVVNGAAGITASATPGKVKKPASGNGRGINLAADTTGKRVYVLI